MTPFGPDFLGPDFLGLGRHAAYILAAWGVTLATLGGLFGWTLADHRAQKAALADLDRRGVTRRSGARAADLS